ncbi:hypothetical protein ES703_68370 [subsurface metagenome]
MEVELFIDTIASDLPQVILLRGKEHTLHKFLGHIDAGSLTGPEVAIEPGQGFFLIRGGVLLQGIQNHFHFQVLIPA